MKNTENTSSAQVLEKTQPEQYDLGILGDGSTSRKWRTLRAIRSPALPSTCHRARSEFCHGLRGSGHRVLQPRRTRAGQRVLHHPMLTGVLQVDGIHIQVLGNQEGLRFLPGCPAPGRNPPKPLM
jgi:hypothetical protein